MLFGWLILWLLEAIFLSPLGYQHITGFKLL